jgi:hypothetical protein
MKKLTYIFIALATLISLAVFTACNKEDITQKIDPTTIKPKHKGIYTGTTQKAYRYYDESKKDNVIICDDARNNWKCYKFEDPRDGEIYWALNKFTLDLKQISDTKYSSIFRFKNDDSIFDDVMESEIYTLDVNSEISELNLGSSFNYKTLVLVKGNYKITKLNNSYFDFEVTIDSYLK